MAIVLPKCHRRCGQFYGVDVVIYVISCITLNDYCEYNVTVTNYLLLKNFMYVLIRQATKLAKYHKQIAEESQCSCS